MNIEIYSDGANYDQIIRLAHSPLIMVYNKLINEKIRVTDYLYFVRLFVMKLEISHISRSCC